MPDLQFDQHCFVLNQDVYDAFSAHHSGGVKKKYPLRGWDICEQPHEDEMGFICVSNKPNCTPPAGEPLPLSPRQHVSHIQERSASAYGSPKPSRKSPSRPNTGGATVRKSRSSKNIPTATTPLNAFTKSRFFNGDGTTPVLNRLCIQCVPDPSLKTPYRISSPFGTERDISYEFRPYLCHQLHMDTYRKAHTYVLIKKYRELRANGYTGYKLQAALRVNQSGSSVNRLQNEAAKRLCLENLMSRSPLSKETKITKKDQSELKKKAKVEEYFIKEIQTDLPRPALEQPFSSRKSLLSSNIPYLPSNESCGIVSANYQRYEEKYLEERCCHSPTPLMFMTTPNAIFRTMSSNFQKSSSSSITTNTARVHSFAVEEKYRPVGKPHGPFAVAGGKSRIHEAEFQENDYYRKTNCKTNKEKAKKIQCTRPSTGRADVGKNNGRCDMNKELGCVKDSHGLLSLNPIPSSQRCATAQYKEQRSLHKTNSVFGPVEEDRVILGLEIIALMIRDRDPDIKRGDNKQRRTLKIEQSNEGD